MSTANSYEPTGLKKSFKLMSSQYCRYHSDFQFYDIITLYKLTLENFFLWLTSK
jgi:hypothetical protein